MKPKWYWRLLRAGLIGLVILVALAFAVIGEERWRGKRALENYKRQAAAPAGS